MIDTTAKTTLTFDVVGTVIDFEQGILDWWRPHLRSQGMDLSDDAILEGFAAAEDRLQRDYPELPFTAMLAPIHDALAEAWGLERAPEAPRSFQASIAHWPAFADSVPALQAWPATSASWRSPMPMHGRPLPWPEPPVTSSTSR